MRLKKSNMMEREWEKATNERASNRENWIMCIFCWSDVFIISYNCNAYTFNYHFDMIYWQFDSHNLWTTWINFKLNYVSRPAYVRVYYILYIFKSVWYCSNQQLIKYLFIFLFLSVDCLFFLLFFTAQASIHGTTTTKTTAMITKQQFNKHIQSQRK